MNSIPTRAPVMFFLRPHVLTSPIFIFINNTLANANDVNLMLVCLLYGVENLSDTDCVQHISSLINSRFSSDMYLNRSRSRFFTPDYANLGK